MKVLKLALLGFGNCGQAFAKMLIGSTTSIVSITTDLMGKLSIVEHQPEIEQTAYGVFSDMLRVIEFTFNSR